MKNNMIIPTIFAITDSVLSFLLSFCSKKFQKWFRDWKPIHLCWWFKKHDLKIPKYLIGAEDYDFITTCNWTSTGTFTLRAYRGSSTNVVTSYDLFYRKKGAGSWIKTTNGEVVIASTGEWEIANDWNKSGDDCLTHSYYNIDVIDSCTAVTYNTPGTTVGDYFLYSMWYGCANLASMPVGFNLPTGITSVGDRFMGYVWYGCVSLTSMPVGFNLPTGITSVGAYFVYGAWFGCTSLASMPAGFDIPSGITSVGSNFFFYTWYNCTALDNDDYTEPITFEFTTGANTIGGTCPINNDVDDPIVGTKETPVEVEVNRVEPEAPTVTTQAVSAIAKITATGNGNITDDGGATATRGMCWDTSATPTVADSHATNGTGEGAYTVAMTSLVAGTKYYVRAYATNSHSTTYGAEVEFTTLAATTGNFFRMF